MAERRKVHEVWISAELEGDRRRGRHRRDRRSPPDSAAVRREGPPRTRGPQRGTPGCARPRCGAPRGRSRRSDRCRGGGRGSAPPFLVAVDGVTDPGNLGAIIRSCDGAGVSGVLLPKHRSVHVTPTVTKASAGAVEYVPMALMPGLPAALKQLKDRGIWVVGLDDGADRDLYEIGPLATEPICVVLGAEGPDCRARTRALRLDRQYPDGGAHQFAERLHRCGDRAVRGHAFSSRRPLIGGAGILRPHAGLAQLVEHLICNHEVASSILAPGSRLGSSSGALSGRHSSAVVSWVCSRETESSRASMAVVGTTIRRPSRSDGMTPRRTHS
jgi:hypothetical protein